MVAAALWVLLTVASLNPAPTSPSESIQAPTSSPVDKQKDDSEAESPSSFDEAPPAATNAPPQPQIKKLPPVARVKAMFGLALVIFLGVGLLLTVWVGARLTRRFIQREDRARLRIKRPSMDEDDWAKKPLVPRDPFEDE